MPENYQQAAAAWSKRSADHGIEIERLRNALRKIDTVATNKKRGAIIEVQKIARAALKE